MKQQHILQPKLRFPEFEGDWVLKKIKDIAPLQRGFDLPSTELIYGEYPVVYSNGIQNYHNSFKVDGPGIITGRSGTIGKIHYVEGKYWPHNTSLWVTDFKGNQPKFIYYFFLKLDFTKYNAGSTVPTLNRNDVHDLKKIIPSLPEQQKIADYLSTIDTKINLLEEKKAQLGLYKKAMMQKLFAQEIRFKPSEAEALEAYPEWEEKRLGEVFLGLKGQGLSKDSLLDEGEHNCILYGELFTKYKEVIKSVISKTNTLSGVKSKIGDILIPASTTTNAFDLANATALLLDNVILGGDINILRPKHKLSSEFYAYYLSNFKKYELGKLGQGITIVHLYYSHFKNILIDIPSLPEQQKIANFLSAIDESIEKVTEQISQTQSFKKGMLQQMFV